MTTTTELDLERLKYPRGRVQLVSSPATEQIETWIAEIAALPSQLRGAVQGLTDAQLDTQYRPDGWTVRQVVHHVPDSHMNAYIRTCLVLTEDKPTIKPYMQERYGFRAGLCPVAEEMSGRTLALPFHARLDEDDQEHVASALREALAA